MKAHFASPITGSNNQKDKTMNISAMKKPFGTLALLAAAGMALTGCGILGGGEAEAKTVTADGVYVLAPQDGDLFTLTVAGKKIDVKHTVCQADGRGLDGPVIDPRDTAFGELVETGSEEAVTRQVTWLEGGAYTEKDGEAFEILSAGQIVRMGERNFFDSISDQGKALQEQFTKDCTPEPVIAESATPTPTPSVATESATEVPTPDPTESATQAPTAEATDDVG